MKLRDYIVLLQSLPQDLEVLSRRSAIGEVGAEVLHAKEDGDGVVWAKVSGHGTDYIFLT